MNRFRCNGITILVNGPRVVLTHNNDLKEVVWIKHGEAIYLLKEEEGYHPIATVYEQKEPIILKQQNKFWLKATFISSSVLVTTIFLYKKI